MSARRWATTLVTLAVAAGLLAGCGRKIEFMSAMPEGEANEVIAALQNAGIESEKVPGKEGMVGLTLDAAKVGRAVDLLRDKGLPRERFAGMGQVFRKEGLISSPLEERARYLYALSQELGATLTQMDGVIVARVHVVLPERSATGESAVPSSAAVFIKHQEGYEFDTVQPLIKRLVSNSIPGLTPDKVSLVLVAAQPKPGSRELAADGVPGSATSGASGAAGAQATGSAASAASMAALAAGTASRALQSGPPRSTALVSLVVILAVLLLAAIGLAGMLAWRYWWPQRLPRPQPAVSAGA